MSAPVPEKKKKMPTTAPMPAKPNRCAVTSASSATKPP